MNMRFFVFAILLMPNILFAQSNELYKLLKWDNTKQQQQLIAWYDIQDNSTIELSSSNSIKAIKDKSIWKNNIKQLDNNYQPLLVNDDDFSNTPKKGISFENGGFMKYNFQTTKSIDAITSFVVCKNKIGGSRLLFDLSLEGGEGVASCYSGENKIESRVPNSLADFEPASISNEVMIIATRGKAGDIESNLNELSYLGRGSRNFYGSSYNRIRLSTEPGIAPTDGRLYELIIFNQRLNDEEYKKVKIYLSKKYGISNIHFETENETNRVRSSLIEGSLNQSGPSSVNSGIYQLNPDLKNQDCEIIISEYEKFAAQYIRYAKRFKSNPLSSNLSEYNEWENVARKMSDVVYKCAKGNNALRVLNPMEKVLAAAESLSPPRNTSSSNNQTNSNYSSGYNSNSSKITKPNQPQSKPANKPVDLSYEVLSQIVSCKTCGSSVTVEKNVPRSPEFKQSFNQMGGVTSSMCRKCNKVSQFTYEIKAGRFTKIN